MQSHTKTQNRPPRRVRYFLDMLSSCADLQGLLRKVSPTDLQEDSDWAGGVGMSKESPVAVICSMQT